jgi:hypothetical protein
VITFCSTDGELDQRRAALEDSDETSKLFSRERPHSGQIVGFP